MVAKSKLAKNVSSNKLELLFRVGKDVPKWYNIDKTSPSSANAASSYEKLICQKLYQTECELYQKLHQEQQGSDYQWLQTSLSTTAKVCIAVRLETQ